MAPASFHKMAHGKLDGVDELGQPPGGRLWQPPGGRLWQVMSHGKLAGVDGL